MANPVLPELSGSEQELLYKKLNDYNQGRPSFKETGTYLVALPRPECTNYTLWIYSPLPKRQSIFYICDLSPCVHESMRMASTLCFYSTRRLLLVEYNAKRMQSLGDDIISFGKYRGHFLHEILRIDPAYLAWVAFKFIPRIPKQERFMQIAQIYQSVYLDFQKRKSLQSSTNNGRYLGKEGEKLENLTLKVLRVRLDDDPYKTTVKGNIPYFYVSQTLTLTDSAGNLVTLRISAHTASHESCQLSALEHAYKENDTVQIASARVSRCYQIGNKLYTRLTHVKLC